MSDRDLFSPGSLSLSDPLESSIPLSEFAAWCNAANPPLGYVPLPLLEIGELLAYQRQEKKRKAAGRYTLEEAAEHLEIAGERNSAMLGRLKQAAEKGALPMYEPGREARIVYGSGEGQVSLVREFHEHVYWDDLNRWLEENEPRIKYRFPRPNTTVAPTIGGLRPGVLKHSTKTKRRDSLDPAIEHAQSKCKDPKDTAEVWAQLQVLAQTEHPPLLAVTPDGLKYTRHGNKAAHFTRNALDKRLHPEKRQRR